VTPTRVRLIDAAARLLDEGGTTAVTLRAVGRLAGVSHNAPYKHFAGKEDLLAAVAARELGDRGARPDRSRAEPDARQLMHAYVRWALRYPARFKLTFGAWSPGSAGSGIADLAAAAAAARSGLVAAVERGQAAGELPAGDPDRVAALALAVAHGAADLALNGHLSPAGKGHARPQDLVDDLFDQLGRQLPARCRCG